MAYVDEAQLAVQIAQQYCDLLDNHRDQLSLYLNNDAVLHWFGRTICGKDNVTSFLNEEIANTIHKMVDIEPADPTQIQFRSKREKRGCEKPLQDCSSLQEKCLKSFSNLSVNDCGSSSGCGSRNSGWSCDSTMELDDCTGSIDPPCCFDRCFKASGDIQFCRTRMSPSSHKNLKLAANTMKWERSFKMHILYSFFQHQGEFRNFELQNIMYEDVTRCKRNLALEFDKIA